MGPSATQISLGARFSTYEDLEKALTLFEQDQNITYWKRHTRSVKSAGKRINFTQSDAEKYAATLKYYEVVFCCIRGGRKYLSQTTGLRPNQKSFRASCGSHVRLSGSRDLKYLIVTSMSTAHNHAIHKESFDSLPKRRKLTADELEDLRLFFTTYHPKKQFLKEYILKKMKKIVTSTDLSNICKNFKSTSEIKKTLKSVKKTISNNNDRESSQSTVNSMSNSFDPLSERAVESPLSASYYLIPATSSQPILILPDELNQKSTKLSSLGNSTLDTSIDGPSVVTFTLNNDLHPKNTRISGRKLHKLIVNSLVEDPTNVTIEKGPASNSRLINISQLSSHTLMQENEQNPLGSDSLEETSDDEEDLMLTEDDIKVEVVDEELSTDGINLTQETDTSYLNESMDSVDSSSSDNKDILYRDLLNEKTQENIEATNSNQNR